MRDSPIFNFVPRSRDDLDKEQPQPSGQDAGGGDAPGFEPTRDGWRAYQAWCKQVREGWKPDE